MERINITLTRYHTRYQTFSLNLTWFGGYLQRLPRVIVKLIKKVYYFFLKKLTVTRGAPFFMNNQKFKQSPENLLNNSQTICRGEQEMKIKQSTARNG